jgi:dTDP-4-amino-4,6-dideoxygalactose transaminase
MREIPIGRPYFGDEELRAVQLPLETGWVVQGPHVAEFERKFAAFTEAKQAVAVSNCTTALHMAVTALGAKPGDEVIVPAFTWVATPNSVEYQGARAVFCDVGLETFNMNVATIERSITPRTVGLIVVHLFGLCADLDPIMDLARRRGLWVIEDAACAFGALYRGRHAGTMGDAGCFSFHPRKSITTGEGGMITTASADLASAFRSLRDHGASSRQPDALPFLLPDYDRLGYNYRMTDVQGALGSVQMDRASWILEQRRARAAFYDDRLQGLEWLATPFVPEGFVHGYQAYVCLFRPEAPSLANVDRLSSWRNAVMSELAARGISTRQGTHAPHTVGYYRRKYEYEPGDYPNAWIAQQLSLAIPLYAQMTAGEQEAVIDALREAFEGTREHYAE